MTWFLAQNPVLQGFIASLFTYLVTSAGAGLVFFFKYMNRLMMDLMLAFSAGVMIAASFWSLLSPAIELSAELGGNAWLTAASGFILGGIFIIVSDILLSKADLIKLTSVAAASASGDNASSLKRSILLAAAVTLHNIPEGLAIGVAFGSVSIGIEGASIWGAVMLTLGIGIQDFPEGVCVAMPLRREGFTRLKSFIIGQASGIVEPAAAVLGVIFVMAVRNALPMTLSFSAGAMITVVCSELIPESFKNNKNTAALGVLSGFSVMMILDVALG